MFRLRGAIRGGIPDTAVHRAAGGTPVGGPDPFATAYVPVCDACGDRGKNDPDFGARFDAAVIDSCREEATSP